MDKRPQSRLLAIRGAPRESLSYLSAHGMRLACLMVMMMLGMHYTIFVANRLQPPALPVTIFSAILIGFALALLWWIVRLYRRFPKADQAR